ncbi:hypothetical protein RYX36_032419 [Vicia faba]
MGIEPVKEVVKGKVRGHRRFWLGRFRLGHRPKVNNSDDDEGTSSATAPIMPSSAVDSARR